MDEDDDNDGELGLAGVLILFIGDSLGGNLRHPRLLALCVDKGSLILLLLITLIITIMMRMIEMMIVSLR